jgi:hypothetical protein
VLSICPIGTALELLTMDSPFSIGWGLSAGALEHHLICVDAYDDLVQAISEVRCSRKEDVR